MSLLKRAAVTCSASALVIAGAVAVAPAAQARTSDCVQYIVDRGYRATPKRVDACANGSRGEWYSQQLCFVQLRDSRIRVSHAETACRLAAAA